MELEKEERVSDWSINKRVFKEKKKKEKAKEGKKGKGRGGEKTCMKSEIMKEEKFGAKAKVT